MEPEVKKDIIKMLIPIIGTYWVLERFMKHFWEDDLNWWWYSNKAIPTHISLIYYQIICWISLKVINMMYAYNLTFEQVFTQ